MLTGLSAVQAQPAVFEFPFAYREGLIWVRVQTPGSDRPLNFLLDSGAVISVLDLEVAKRLGIKLGERVSVRGVQTETIGYWPQRLAASIGGVELPTTFLALDLSTLGQGCKCAVDGLVGAEFFKGRIVQLDFDQFRVRVLKATELSENAITVPMRKLRGALQVPLQVNQNGAQWVRLDTGCASALEWVVCGPRLENTARRTIGLAETRVAQAPMTVRLGGAKFDAVPTGVHDKPIFPSEHGLLGMGLIARFSTVTVDAKAGRLILVPRRASD